MICLICNSSHENNRKLSKHIKHRHPDVSMKIYVDDFLKLSNKCKICLKETNFVGMSGYKPTCNHVCGAVYHRQRLKENSIKYEQFQNKVRKNVTKWHEEIKGTKEEKEIIAKMVRTSQEGISKLSVDERKKRFGWMNKLSLKDKKQKVEEILNKSLYKFYKEISDEDLDIFYTKRSISVMRSPLTGYRRKGIFRPKFPEKYDGDHRNIVWRSSWELKFMLYLDSHDTILKWNSEEIRIKYISPIDNRRHTYFPDFKVVTKDNIFLVEIKPFVETKPPKKQQRISETYLNRVKMWGKNEAKWDAAQSYCQARNWEFKILTEKDIPLFVR
jgi:hypothetical protein